MELLELEVLIPGFCSITAQPPVQSPREGVEFTAETRKRCGQSVKEVQWKLEQADDHVWEQLKDGVADMWATLLSTLEDTVAIFKEGKD